MRPHHRRHARLQFESLENRCLMAADFPVLSMDIESTTDVCEPANPGTSAESGVSSRLPLEDVPLSTDRTDIPIHVEILRLGMPLQASEGPVSNDPFETKLDGSLISNDVAPDSASKSDDKHPTSLNTIDLELDLAAVLRSISKLEINAEGEAKKKQDSPTHDHELHGVPDFSAGGQSTLDGASADSVVHLTGVERVDAPVTVRAIGVHGKLIVANELRVKDLLVYPDGELILEPGASIVIRDLPIDLTADPEQWGTGINVFGTFTAIGSQKESYARAVSSLFVGQTSLVLDHQPLGWKVGDTLIIADTQQRALGEGYVDRNEVVVITAITGTEITFSAPLRYNHPGLIDNPWDLKRFAPVGNLTRDVTIRSENASGTRGHVAFHGEAQVTTHYVAFENLGRTNTGQLDESNAAGRYPWHVHHFTGSADAEGCAIDGFLKWGMVIHDARSTRLANNVVSRGIGAGIVTEQGTEIGNYIIQNFVCAIRGSREHPSSPHGENSDGYWFRAPGNFIDGNLAFGCQGIGFDFNGYGRTRTRHAKLETVYPDTPLVQPLLSFVGNESAACTTGLWFTWSEAQSNTTWQRQTVQDFFGWHNTEGMEAYHEGAMSLVNATFISDPDVARRNRGSHSNAETYRGIGIHLSKYECTDWVIEAPRVYGFQVGIMLDTHVGEQLTINNPQLSNHVNIMSTKAADWPDTLVEDESFLGDGDDVGPGKFNVREPIPSDPVDVFLSFLL